MPGNGRYGNRDYSNNEQQNFVFQNVSEDEQRGLPRLGKVVYDTRLPGLSTCVDTDPNPTLFGGGTWTGVTGGTIVDWTPVLIASGGDPSLGSTGAAFGRLAVVGEVIHAWVWFQFNGTGIVPGGTGYCIESAFETLAPLYPYANDGMSCGSGHLWDSSTSTLKPLIIVEAASKFALRCDGVGASNIVGGSVPWTWAANDIITAHWTYRSVFP